MNGLRVRAADGTTLHCESWGDGSTLLFVHGWSLHSQMWEHQVAALAGRGMRCVIYDRRGHGRSDRPDSGYDADTLAGDLAAVLQQLDLREVTLVGHSMGGGEIARYLARHGAARVARAVLVSAATPFLRCTPDHPVGLTDEEIDALSRALSRDRHGWFASGADGYFARGGSGCWVSPALVDATLRMCVSTPLPVQLACLRTYTGTDYRDDLAGLRAPVLIVHGDADASAPLELTGRASAALVPGARLDVYAGAPHGLYVTEQDRLSADLLAFARS